MREEKQMLYLEAYLAIGLIIFLYRMWIEWKYQDWLSIVLSFMLIAFCWLPTVALILFLTMREKKKRAKEPAPLND